MTRTGLTGAAAAAAALFFASGCTSTTKVAFTNVTDTWLNVRYYSNQMPLTPAPHAADAEAPEHLTASDTLQIAPGATMSYSLSRNRSYQRDEAGLVHVHVQPVTPSWEGTTTEYWLELLTLPPMTIVATGSANGMSFISGNGALAPIPASRITSGEFVHEMIGDATPPSSR